METTLAWNSNDFRPTDVEVAQLSASGWLAEGRFDSTDDENFLFVPTQAGEREDGRRPPNAPNRSKANVTGRHFYRIFAKTMLDATEKGEGLTTEENAFKARQWNLLVKLERKRGRHRANDLLAEQRPYASLSVRLSHGDRVQTEREL